MPQFLRPDDDKLLGTWLDELGGSVDIFQSIDEVTPSDADFIKSIVNPTPEVYVCGLSDVTDPLDDTNHFIRVRARKQPSGAAQMDMTVQLRQGYVNEGSPGTLIDGLLFTNVADTFGDFVVPITDPSLITDYTDLFLRFVAQQV